MATTEVRSVGRRRPRLRHNPEALGAHSVFSQDRQTGRISRYATFDAQGGPVLRFRATGRPHAGLPPPLVLVPQRGKGRGSPPKVPRLPRPEEMPKGV